MCVSCGCGDPNTRHMQGDIVLEDLIHAARNHQIPVDQVISNIDAMRGEAVGSAPPSPEQDQ